MMDSVARRASSGRLVGRLDELSVGEAAVRTVLDGESSRSAQVLLIAGDAGIGKSRLLDELLDRARKAGAVTACGRCLEHGGEIRPLNAVVEILSELGPVAWSPSATPNPSTASTVDNSNPEAGPAGAQARLFDRMRSALRALSAGGAVVVGVEDLHWSDRTTRVLLAELARVPGLARVLFVATFRSDELHRRHPLLPLLADLEQAARPERIDLAPLDEREVVELADAILEVRIDQERGAELHRRSGGNPFYVEELLAGGAAGADTDRLPAGVRHVILARTQSLDPDAVACLQAASTLAAPIDPLVLRAAARLEVERFRPALDTVCGEGFLIEEGSGFSFRHELVREVFIDELLPGERAGLFARAARALEEHRPERLGEIARLHHKAAQLTEAFAFSVQAAEAASSIGASAEAREHYGRALDLWDRVGDAGELAGVSRVRLLRRAAEVADLARDFDLAVELARRAIDEAADAGDRFEEGAANFDLSGYLWNASLPGMQVAIERALELLPREPPTVERTRAELRSVMNDIFAGNNVGADEALEDVVAMAAELGERGLGAVARAHVDYRQARLGDENVLRRFSDELSTARSIDDGWAATVIAVNLTDTLIDLGRYQEAADLHPESSALAERHGFDATAGILLDGNVLMALEPLGRWDEAEALMSDIRRRLTADTIHRWASAFLGWTQIQINRGNHAEVVVGYRRSQEMSETGYYTGDSLPIGSGLVELAAIGAIDPIGIDTVGSWLDEVQVGGSLPRARLVAGAARHLIPPPSTDEHVVAVDTVQGWIDRLQSAVDGYVTDSPVVETWLEQARTEVIEATGQPAPERWAAQVTAWDEVGCPFFAAEARYRHADALLRAGGGRSAADRTEAVRLLAEARRIAHHLGAVPLSRNVDDLARRARLRLDVGAVETTPTADEPTPFGLTDRELQVLRLVNEGHSNREIGDALFISIKTASVHVSNILRKLGAANRIEAAAIGRRHRILDP